MNKENIQEIDLSNVDKLIKNKINNFIEQYHKYPKYLKIPLWISCYMKRAMKDMEHYNLDYNTELLMYRDLIVCETTIIDKLEEIEVF